MNILQAIILGIVQGLTEFIPISSTAHLVFASRWTNIYNGDPQQITATMAVIQLGTLAAVIVYFAKAILGISVAFIHDHIALITGKRASSTWASDDSRLGWLAVLGSIPIGVIGLLFKDRIEGPDTKILWVIATMMIVIAIFLGIAELVGSHRKELREFGIKDAVIVGFSQVLALIPGASRSGS